MEYRTLGDTIYLWFAVNSTAGEATDATGSPTFDVRKGGASSSGAPTLEGTATLLSHANYPAGCYEIAIAATGGNGFEADAEYGVFCQAAVSSVNPVGFVGKFKLSPVPADSIKIGSQTAGLSSDNRLRVDVAEWNDIPLDTTNPLPNSAPGVENGLPVLDVNERVATDVESVGGTDDDVDRLVEFMANLSVDGELTSDNLAASAVTEIQSGLATSAEVTGLNVNTRANVIVPVEIETPDASTQVYKIRLFLFDVTGSMEVPDSTPTVALVNAAGTDRSSRLSVASNPSTGVYSWDYTATAGDAEEQLNWTFTVVEGGLTRVYPAVSYVVEETAYRFSSTDRSKLTDIHGKLPSKAYLTGTTNSDGDVELNDSTGDFNATQQTRIQTQAAAAITAYDPLQTGDYTAPDNAGIATASAQATAANTALGLAGAGLTSIPRTGYKLASDGLDQIPATDPGGVASTFPQMVVQLWRRFFKRATMTSSQIKTYADDNTTVRTTQTTSDDGTTQTQGPAA